jgi:hypothetical protein
VGGAGHIGGCARKKAEPWGSSAFSRDIYWEPRRQGNQRRRDGFLRGEARRPVVVISTNGAKSSAERQHDCESPDLRD